MEKIEEAIDYVNDRLPSDDSCMPVVNLLLTLSNSLSMYRLNYYDLFFNCKLLQSPDPKSTNASDIEAQIPSELITKCVATLLMIQVKYKHKAKISFSQESTLVPDRVGIAYFPYIC